MLLFDIGNSRCKWVRVQAGHWVHQGVLDNDRLQALPALLARLPVPQRVLVANVAGDAVAARLDECCRTLWQLTPHYLQASAECCGVRNRYQVPASLGSDRWAALIAARAQVDGACLVVNCGTATTVDALSAEGEFLGGLILPGVSLMLHSLQGNTAQLSAASGVLCDYPRQTSDAMWSGALRATHGAIRHQYEILRRQAGEVRCLLGGGAATAVLTELELPAEHFEHMVLHGVQRWGEQGI
ncbi:MAG: type III pantothenate kinase [Pseudomonadota bacterium]